MASTTCHGGSLNTRTKAANKVVLVGSPNVGKSLIFNRLSGAYVTVSNYPGTTVEVSRAHAKVDGVEYELLDTPGLYSLVPLTEEERVTRRVLLDQKPALVIQVVDARDPERMLPLTIQLIEMGLPLILDLNMMDEAERMGLTLDAERLEAELGIPVVTTVATSERGVAMLKRKLSAYLNGDGNEW